MFARLGFCFLTCSSPVLEVERPPVPPLLTHLLAGGEQRAAGPLGARYNRRLEPNRPPSRPRSYRSAGRFFYERTHARAADRRRGPRPSKLVEVRAVLVRTNPISPPATAAECCHRVPMSATPVPPAARVRWRSRPRSSAAGRHRSAARPARRGRIIDSLNVNVTLYSDYAIQPAPE